MEITELQLLLIGAFVSILAQVLKFVSLKIGVKPQNLIKKWYVLLVVYIAALPLALLWGVPVVPEVPALGAFPQAVIGFLGWLVDLIGALSPFAASAIILYEAIMKKLMSTVQERFSIDTL